MNFRSRDFWPKSLPFLEDQLRSRPKWSYAHWQFGPGFESCSKFLITVRLQTLTQILTKTVMKNKPPRVFSPRWLYSPNKSLLVVGCWKHFPHSSVSLFQDFFSIFFLIFCSLSQYWRERVRTESGRDVGASHKLLSRQYWRTVAQTDAIFSGRRSWVTLPGAPSLEFYWNRVKISRKNGENWARLALTN